jgi:hypothetical protein
MLVQVICGEETMDDSARQGHRTIKRGVWTGLLVVVFSVPAVAEVHDIRATFQPDSANPQKNQFTNQTPSEGFCAQVPQACAPLKLFSLIARIPFTANAPILANHTDPRQGGMARVPSDWRDVSVTHSSGDVTTLQVRIAAIGHESLLPRSISELTGGGTWDDLWEGGRWLYAPAPCVGVGWGTVGNFGYNSFWVVPVGAGVCSKKAKFDIPLSFRYQYIVFGYELRTPDPLKMASGDYTGVISYTVGPGQDFDMGDVMIPSDSVLTLNFSLEVSHTLKVDVPPGGNRVELVPEGGWQSWLTKGRKPTRLFRDQTFNISASSRFKMKMECQYSHDGRTCGVVEPVSGHAVPLNVSVSLPHGLTDAAGQAVDRRPLRIDGSGTALFQPGFYVDRKPGTLHFEIPAAEVGEMIHPGQARQYSGSVAVIWDSDV